MKLIAVLGLGLLGATLTESKRVFVTVKNGGHFYVDANDDADSELGIKMPNNKGFINIVQGDAFDNELANTILDIPNNSGSVKVNKWNDDELRIKIPNNQGFVNIVQDDADNELADNRISIPGNKGNVTINQFDDDNELFSPDRQPKVYPKFLA